MFQVSCQNIENFSRNSYFQVGGLHVHVRVLIIVCAIYIVSFVHCYKQEIVCFECQGIRQLKRKNYRKFGVLQIGKFNLFWGKYRPFFHWEWGRNLVPKTTLKNPWK